MDWIGLVGKKIFVQLKTGAVYSGIVLAVDNSNPSLIFITMKDRRGDKVTFVNSEIIKLVEEENAP